MKALLRARLYALCALALLSLASCVQDEIKDVPGNKPDYPDNLRGSYWVQQLPEGIPLRLNSLFGATRAGQIAYRTLHFGVSGQCTLFEREGERGGSSLALDYSIESENTLYLVIPHRAGLLHRLTLSPDSERLYITTDKPEMTLTRWDRLPFVRATQLNGLINVEDTEG